ncbi:hypothetical protein L2E82_45299 [Cichorium intybus]|uniref:Uncharacterized protein n=1 Tax=Cichorium intybus TaxID=13427 RepID=A0ACB8ZSX5_CICIN|nr:hypothetical protein L2E82_45299 [Cichorium intybus]
MVTTRRGAWSRRDHVDRSNAHVDRTHIKQLYDIEKRSGEENTLREDTDKPITWDLVVGFSESLKCQKNPATSSNLLPGHSLLDKS